MKTHAQRYDVVVVGAGTAGSAVAALLAAAGRSVALVERGPLAAAGARWAALVPDRFLRAAGLDPDTLPGNRGRTGRLWLFGPVSGVPQALDLEGVRHIDGPALTAHLHERARDAGVAVYADCPAGLLTLGPGGRPRALSVTHPGRGPAGRAGHETLRADLFVDASGLAGVLRQQVPLCAHDCPPVPAAHVCDAAEQVCTVASAVGARRYLQRHGVRPGEVLNWTGGDGGFSVLAVRVTPDLGEVELLAGVIADGQHTPPPTTLERVRAAEPWIGPPQLGGRRLIPLRRPYDRLVVPGLALVGDAACQVFPSHASGIGTGLVAATRLAEAVAATPDPGELAPLWRYAARVQRELGPLLAANDVFRRFSQTLAPAELDRLMQAGLLLPGAARAALEQRLPAFGPTDLRAAWHGLPAEPRLALRVARPLARMAAISALYALFPETPEPRALGRFARAAAWLAGDPPPV